MKDLPYFPLYAAEMEAETAHLTLEEDGAYQRLLRHAWRTPGCSLPADDKWLRRRLRVSAEEFERVVRPVIDEFFEKKRDRLHSPVLTSEFEKISETREKRSSAGKKSASARKGLKRKENDTSRASTKNQPGSNNIYSEEDAELEPDTDLNSDIDTHHIKGKNIGTGDCVGEDAEKVVPLRREPQSNEADQDDEPIVGGIAPGCRGLYDEFAVVWREWDWRSRDIEEHPDQDIEGKTRAAYCIARRKTTFFEIVEGLKRYTYERIGEDEEFTKRLRNWLFEERWNDEHYGPGEVYRGSEVEPDALSKAGTDAMEGWT